jgi:hypothetical protein
MTAIGDVHGFYGEYLRIIKNTGGHTVQVGDMGFDYTPILSSGIDFSRHRFFKGNHDNFDVDAAPFDLGRYGNTPDFFWVSGAFSIDKHFRILGRDWFPQEELNYRETHDCMEMYAAVKPTVVLSHDCPRFIFGYKSHTSVLLANLFEVHRPALWIFGHHHVSLYRNILGTEFKCLSELDTFRF